MSAVSRAWRSLSFHFGKSTLTVTCPEPLGSAAQRRAAVSILRQPNDQRGGSSSVRAYRRPSDAPHQRDASTRLAAQRPLARHSAYMGRKLSSPERHAAIVGETNVDDSASQQGRQAANKRRGPLTSLRVIDLGQVVAGPLASTLLADLGADVIKVEPPTGDLLRRSAPRKDNISLWWKVNGRNKRCMTLDLKNPDELEIFFALVRKSDIVIESSVPGAMERLGAGYDDLKRHNPSLVYVSVSGFGQSGPYRDRKAFGRTAEAFGGMAYITGHPDKPPVHPGFAAADTITALFAAFSALAGIIERESNAKSEGQHVDIALYESVFRLLEPLLIAYDQLGIVTERVGSSLSHQSPIGVFQAADGAWISMTGGPHQEMVKRLFQAMDMSQLAIDPRFATNEARVTHRDELDKLIADWIGSLTSAEIIHKCKDFGVPMAPVLSIAQIAEDQHYLARETFITVHDEELGDIRMQGVVPRFSRTPGEVRHAGQTLGQSQKNIINEWLDEKE